MEPLEKKKKKPVDWEEIHRRFEAAGRALEERSTLSPEEKKKILRKRAKELAAGTSEKERVGEGLEVVEFLLSYERYALESSYIREVYPLKGITPLPGTPPFVAGIVNVRGHVLSVIDLKKFFDLPEKGLGDLNKIIIIGSGEMEFGILADSVLGTRTLSFSELQPALPTLTGIRDDYLKGIAGARLVVLDGGKILADKSIVVDQGA